MPTVRTFVTITGEIHGELWMPNAHASVFVRERIEINRVNQFISTREADSVSEAVDRVMQLHGGDFATARFTPDTEIAVEREWWIPNASVMRAPGGDRLSEGPLHVRRRRVIDLSRSARADLYVSECDGHYSDDEEEEAL